MDFSSVADDPLWPHLLFLTYKMVMLTAILELWWGFTGLMRIGAGTLLGLSKWQLLLSLLQHLILRSWAIVHTAYGNMPRPLL
jgi:hypothetical protein